MWSDAEVLERMQRGWSSTPETPCGDGSSLKNTETVRARLPALCREYEITSICDAGAGDLYWPSSLLASLPPYQAFDLLPRHPLVREWDISKHALPPCDLIICRYVLIHLDLDRVMRALSLFKKSARYLLATTYPKKPNRFNRESDFNQWDLSSQPFSLGQPLELIAECRPESFMGLWVLS